MSKIELDTDSLIDALITFRAKVKKARELDYTLLPSYLQASYSLQHKS